MAILCIAPGAVAAALLCLYWWTVATHEKARSWVKTPCQIVTSEFRRTDDGEMLDIEYRYDFNGASFTGDRLDLLPGRVGTDDRWERELAERLPAGSTADCFVDPRNPTQSVLDREHGLEGTRTLRLLAMPFLAASLGMLFATILGAVRGQRRSASQPVARSAPSTHRGSTLDGIGQPPRVIGFWTSVAVVLGPPSQYVGAWIAWTGCWMLFLVLDGAAVISSTLDWMRPHATTQGVVVRSAPTRNREFGFTMYEVSFRYTVDGVERTGYGYVRGDRFEPAEPVDVYYDPAVPEKAQLGATRESEIPWWVLTPIIGVGLLLAAGLTGMYAHGLRGLWLLRHGMAAPGRFSHQDEHGVYRFYSFLDNTVERTARCARGLLPRGDAEHVTILFDATRPKRCMVYETIRAALPARDDSSVPVMTARHLLPQGIVPPVCVALCVLFYFMGQ